MRPEDLRFIQPMGLVSDGHVTPIDHQYYAPIDMATPPDRYDVMAPADGAIVSIQRRAQYIGDRVPAGAKEVPDYRVFIELSCSFWVYYDLMTALAPDVAAQAGDVSRGTVFVRIPVRAGQVIGKVGGRTLDVGVVNADVTLPGFLVPEHYEREPWKIHTVDPFDYFAPPLREALLAKNLRTVPPYGGKIDFDVDGRLAGNWFARGTNGYAGADPQRSWAGHLSFVYDYLDPSKVRVSIGTFKGRARQFGVVGNAPDPASVGPETGIVKYTLVMYEYTERASGRPWTRARKPEGGVSGENLPRPPEGVLLVRLEGPRTARVEVFPDARPEAVQGFTSQAVLYDR
jgi:hypothetical protein